MIIKTNIKKFKNEKAEDFINLPFTDITNQSIDFNNNSLEINGVKVIGVVTGAEDLGEEFELTISLNLDIATEYINDIPTEIVIGKFERNEDELNE